MMPTATSWPSGLPGRENEDAVRTAPGLAIVLDGSGVPPRYRGHCTHSVAWFSGQMADALAERLGDRAVPVREAVRGAIEHVASLHPECDPLAGGPTATFAGWRALPALADGGEGRIEWFNLCDAAVLALLRSGDGREEAVELTDDRLERVVAATAPGPRHDTIEAQRNRPGGFWLLGGDPRAADELLTGMWRADEVVGLAAVSDGVLRAKDKYGQYDVEGLVRALISGDHAAVLRPLRAAEDADEHPESKRHDDATVASWSRV